MSISKLLQLTGKWSNQHAKLVYLTPALIRLMPPSIQIKETKQNKNKKSFTGNKKLYLAFIFYKNKKVIFIKI